MPFFQCLGRCFGAGHVPQQPEIVQEQPLVAAARQVQGNLPAQALQQPVPPLVRHDGLINYQRTQGYQPRELLQFMERKAYAPEDLNHLLTDLAFYLEDGSHPRKLRIEIFSALATNLRVGQEIFVDDVPRQRDFFGNAAVDLILEELDIEPNRANRDKLVGAIRELVTQYAPDQQQFIVGGIPRGRAELLDWMIELSRPEADFANHLEAGLRDPQQQSVHHVAIRKHGALVFEAMKRSVPASLNIPFNQTCAELRARFANHPQLQDFEEVFQRFSVMVAPNPEVGFDTNLPGVLTVVWNYIKNHTDEAVKVGLEEALQHRLVDIWDEMPCCTGCIERLLDVPSGVDPRLSLFNRTGAVRDDVAKMASRINNEFTTIFEGTELANEELLEFLDPQFLTELKTGMLQEAVKQELKGVRGLSPAEFEKEVERMIPGFQ